MADAAGRFSYPLWLAKRWEDEFGADFALSLMAPQGAPEIFIRVNPLKTTPEALLQQIKAEKTDTEGVLVYKDGPISKSEAFAGGLFFRAGQGIWPCGPGGWTEAGTAGA